MLAGPLCSATFFVTNTADSGPGSLRDAILQANANFGPDVIRFQIGAGLQTIVLLSSLPPLNDPTGGTTIDGFSQPGSSAGANPPSTAVPLIELQGQFTSGDGILVLTDDNVVRGLVINGFPGDGIHVHGPAGRSASRNLLFANFVGTDPTGTVAVGNGVVGGPFRAGIHVGNEALGVAAQNVVEASLVSANWKEGVWIEGPRQPGDVGANVVTGCYIGTDVTGTVGLGNHGEGVAMTEGTHDNAVTDCVICDNGTDGVGMQGFDNTGFGAPIQTHDNRVARNLIGVDVNLHPLANGLHGVAIGQYGGVSWGHADRNVVEDNVIANNGGSGVAVVEVFNANATNADRNRISRNAIRGNSGLGIDLMDDGVTPNDPGDADQGANQQLNFPMLLTIGHGGLTTLTGTLDIDPPPSGGETVEFFKADADASLHGEGEWYLGAAAADGAGNWSFTTDLLVPGDLVTMTVTDLQGNTSEFAPNATVPGTPSLTADVRAFPYRLGGVSNFTLDAGPAWAGRVFAIGGSITGTMPGIPLGTVTVPLNYDPFTATMLTMLNTPVFANFFGVLDGNGRATAQLDLTGIPNAGWNGLVMHYAYVLLPFDFASNPVAIQVTAW